MISLFDLNAKVIKQDRLSNVLRNKVHYTFKFASIISPGSLKNLSLLTFNNNTKTTKSKNIFIKQSYVLLTWLNYIRETKTNLKQKTTTDTMQEESIPSFFVYPIRQSRLTYLKAPMAHKTFSQEQFLTKSYTMSISFNNNFLANPINSVNSSIYTILFIRKNLPLFESNLIFLKKLKVTVPVSDKNYMTIF